MADGRHRAEPTGRPGQHIPAVRPDVPDSDTRGPRAKDRRPGPRHAAPTVVAGEPRTKAVKKAPAKKAAAPAKAAPSSSAPSPRRGGGSGGAATMAAGSAVASHSAASAAAGGPPSVTGRAVGGASAGAAAGAAVGSVVPVVGTAVGAAVGAGIGGVGGAASGARAKRAYKRAMAPNPQAKKLVVIEFAVCIVIVALSPLTDRHKEEPPGAIMKRFTAVMALFFVLGLLSSAGRGGARFAAGLGGLVAVSVAVSERDLFVRLAAIFASRNDQPAATTGPTPSEVDTASMSGSRTLPGRRGGDDVTNTSGSRDISRFRR